MKRIAILGSTGSIGRSTLEVAAEHPDRFRVVALAAGDNVTLLAEQVRRFHPALVSTRTSEGASQLRARLGRDAPPVVSGPDGLGAVAQHPDAQLVVSAIVVAAGKDIALANKETLVMAGALVLKAAEQHQVRLLPVDSEHAAILQSLIGHHRHEVRRIVLTASGGPFRDWPRERVAQAGRADALAHPTWRMGPKITVDSATLMNKGLEVIEAHWLFGAPPDKIDVVVHTESIVHSMVEFHDGQVVAQLGVPDMKGPIAYALSYPERLPNVIAPLDLVQVGALRFFPVDRAKFPCLDLAYQALADNDLAPAILNAANEVAVQAFLADRLGFYGISQTIAEVLTLTAGGPADSLEAVLDADERARRTAGEVVARLPKETHR
jgi:1-deoxy-D-xylulose-5-phosphate reductoisomerase